jgi:CRISPR-associated endonuclease/helicase Cas3
VQALAHSAQGGNPPQAYADHIGSVICHPAYGATVNAAHVARYRPRDGQAFVQTVGLAAEYHDLGKLDERNQAVLSQSSKEGLPVNHVDAGVCHLLAEKATRWAALLVYGHHAYRPHCGLPPIRDPRKIPLDDQFRDLDLRGETEKSLGLLLALHREHIPTAQPGDRLTEAAVSPLFLRFALSCLVDADHTDTAQHQGHTIPQAGLSLQPAERLASLDRYVGLLAKEKRNARTGFRVKVYQAARRCVDAYCASGKLLPPILACDSPVGTGKTTAIMAHLLRVAAERGLRRVFVVLPFTNIIDQSVEVYRRALRLPGETEADMEVLVCAHHHRADFDRVEAREYAFQWHAPVVVVTAVQFFETLASNNPGALRKLHQLAGSAVFIDEAHVALPMHLWPQAWRWLQELTETWGCHVVLASGSLNRFWEIEDLVNPPVKDLPQLLPADCREEIGREESSRIRYSMEERPLRLEELPGYLARLPGPRLMIVNTVQSAAAIADYLSAKTGRVSCEHLSTALCPKDRRVTLEHIKNRLKHGTFKEWTLVATSCVEAGVDISFRTGFRERASLTSLLQIAGRVNREFEFGPGVPVVDFQLAKEAPFSEHPAFGDSAAVLGWLFERNMVAPEHCRDALRKEAQRGSPAKAIAKLRGAEHGFDFPEVAKLFRVIATDTRTVLVNHEIERRLRSRTASERPHWRQIMENTVQVWSNRLPLLPFRSLPGLEDMLVIEENCYDDFLGYMKGVLPLLKAQQDGGWLLV